MKSSKLIQRKRVTKKLVERLAKITNDLFKASVQEVWQYNGDDESLQTLIYDVRRLSYAIRSGIYPKDEDTTEFIKKKERVDDIYLSKIISLSTQELNDILFLHDHRKPVRAERTIEAINSELARRFIMDDTTQSDAINNGGEVYVKRQSRSHKNKASSKRNKTVKG